MKSAANRNFKPHVPGDAYWVGTNLFYLRHKQDLTQEWVAKTAGISARRLRDIENAVPEINVTLDTLSALAKSLGVETKDLFRHHRRGDGIEV